MLRVSVQQSHRPRKNLPRPAHRAERLRRRVAVCRPAWRTRPRAGHTGDQRRAVRLLRSVTLAHGLRLVVDVEGWPVIPGRYGAIEWFDSAELAVYTNHPRLFARLSALPGVRPWQTGDLEMRAVFSVELLSAVARLIRARRRRAGHPVGLRNLRPTPRHGAGSAA